MAERGAGRNVLGTMLRQLRERSGLSLRAAGEAVGFDHAYLQRLECGTKGVPTKTTLGRILIGLAASDSEAIAIILVARDAVVAQWERT